MAVWLIRRIVQATLVVLAMTVIVFIGLHVIGNPIDILISPQADQAERARAIAALGLDKPLWDQYLWFLKDALRGDLGRSFVFNEPALRIIGQRMPATLELAVSAVLISVIFGIPLGLYAGLRPDGCASPRHHGQQHTGFQCAHLLGRSDADHGVRRATRVAAELRARRDCGAVRRPVVLPDA